MSSEPDRDFSFRKFSDFIRRLNQEALLATVAQCTLSLPPHLSGDGDSRYIAKLTGRVDHGGVNAGGVLGAVENTGEGEHHPDDEVAEGGSAGVVSSGAGCSRV